MEPPVLAAPPSGEPGVLRRNAVALGFLLPAAILLGVMVVYPTVYTIIRSFFGKDAHEGFLPSGQFAGIDNYKAIFTTNILLTAIKNSVIWILVAPAVVTAIGLVFAVLTERIRWAVAFKAVVFMPMAISLFATGVIWHVMYIKDPNQGAVNAAVGAVKSWVTTPGALASASPSTPALTGSPNTGYVLQKAIPAGGTALLGLTAIPPTDVPSSAKQVATPQPKPGQRVLSAAAVAGGAVAVGDRDRAEQAEVVEVKHRPGPRRPRSGESPPPEQRMDVVGVDDVRAHPPHRGPDLLRIHAPGQEPPRGPRSARRRARALESLHLVASGGEQPEDVFDRPLLSPQRPVAVVQQQNAHGQYTGIRRLTVVSSPCLTPYAWR